MDKEIKLHLLKSSSHFLPQVDLWLYNVVDRHVKSVQTQLTNLLEWHNKRIGFLQTILTQKMGLFHHTNARDIAPYTKVSDCHMTVM